MALQSYTLTVGAAKDSDNNDKNYVSGQAIYIKKTNGTLASIYRDLAGTSQIAQDGLSNITNANGQFTFFVEAGDYVAEYGSQSTPITVVGTDYFNSRIDETVNQIILDLSTSRGFRVAGDFASGFTYELPNDVGVDGSGNYWVYTDVNALPFVVPAATTPSAPTYTQVTFSDHNSLTNRNVSGAHDASAINTSKGRTAQEVIDDSVDIADYKDDPSGDNASAFALALSETRNLKFSASNKQSRAITQPIKLRNFTQILGGGVAGIFGTDTFYGGVEKSANSTVTITNPERPDVTVDVLFYPDGEYEDGNFPQTFILKDFTAKCTAPSKIGTNFYYKLQGSSTQMENVHILDFQFAVNGYEMWSSYFKKVKTNGRFSWNRGTSLVLDQCSSGGQSTDGTIYGGFEFNEVRYSQLNSCSSDNTPNTAYTFTNCFQFALNQCGSEFTRGLDDNSGDCLNFKGGNQVTVNNYYGVCRQHPTRAAYTFGASDRVTFEKGKLVNVNDSGVPTFDNYDVRVTGSNCYVEFRQHQFTNGSYDSPKIAFNNGVANAIIVVYGQAADRRPKVYTTDGLGNVIERYGIIDSGSNANGYYVKFDDGTMICRHQLNASLFETTSSLSTLVQGINWYRSNAVKWTFPATFINSDIHVSVEARLGTDGSRFVSERTSNVGLTNAQSGDIQLVGVEDFTSGSTGITNLQGVEVTALGRWK